MICERFTFIIICSALSNLAVNNSWATTLSVSEDRFTQNLTIASLSNNSAVKEGKIAGSYNLANYHQIAQSISAGQPEQQQDFSNNSSSSEAPSKINRPWSLVAMAVTSAISLFLLWILFKKPLPNPEAVKELPIMEQEGLKETVDAQSKLESVRERQNKPTQVHSVSGLTQANGTLLKEEVDSTTTNRSIVENLAASSSLVKINSHTDYIDVVVELIQDLQQSDRNIRRKAIWELAKIGDSRSIEPLMTIMPQVRSVDKSLILKAITQITNRSFKPINKQLFALLNDENPEVRTKAILDLTAFYKFVAPIIQQLNQMHLDRDQEVRYRARQALQELNLNYSVSMVDDYPDDADHEITASSKSKANYL